MNNKKSIFAFIFLITAFSIIAEAQSVSTDSENDFVIETIGTSSAELARITGYNGTKTEIRIPRRIRSMTVAAIGENAFYKKGFTAVTIPNNIILIENKAFLGNEITQITIGTNVTLHENSFDLKFYNFYIEKGRRAGTYIFSDGIWTIQTITDPSPVITTTPKPTTTSTKKNKKREAFNIFDMETYGGYNVAVGLWDYGPSSVVPRAGFNLGLLTDIGDVKMGIVGDGGGFLGVSYPYFDDIGISYGFFFGSFIEVFFPNYIGFSLGGGMTKGYFYTRNDMSEDYFFPYAELNLMLGDEMEFWGIFFRYYFNDSNKFYNKFSVGVKVRGF